jgi:hypothetical protein
VPAAASAAAGAVVLLLSPAVAAPVAAAVVAAAVERFAVLAVVVADNDACQSAIACFSSMSSRSCASYVDRVHKTSNSVCSEVHWCANAKYRTAVSASRHESEATSHTQNHHTVMRTMR